MKVCTQRKRCTVTYTFKICILGSLFLCMIFQLISFFTSTSTQLIRGKNNNYPLKLSHDSSTDLNLHDFPSIHKQPSDFKHGIYFEKGLNIRPLGNKYTTTMMDSRLPMMDTANKQLAIDSQNYFKSRFSYSVRIFRANNPLDETDWVPATAKKNIDCSLIPYPCEIIADPFTMCVDKQTDAPCTSTTLLANKVWYLFVEVKGITNSCDKPSHPVSVPVSSTCSDVIVE